MSFNYIIKYTLFIIIFINSFISLTINNKCKQDINYNFTNFGQYYISSYGRKIFNVPEIYLSLTDIKYTYSIEYNIIEIEYYINIFDQYFHLIKPPDLARLYNLQFFCNFYSFEINENIYSFPNIHENKYYLCVEYIKMSEHAKFGITFYKINEIEDDIEYNELFFFNDRIININKNPSNQNNNRFNFLLAQKKFNQLLSEINKLKYEKKNSEESINFKISFLQPPLYLLKREIAIVEGRWSFNNIYERYFCFCRGESCLNILTFNMNDYQSCKYFFYLTIIDNNRHVYPKTHYLLSDFFDENIESSEALPIFNELLKRGLNAHYLTVSPKINKYYCKKLNCLKDFNIIYGIRKINGDFLERYLELILKLKYVIAAEKYDGIDNLFYNLDYIIYIFLGHGVTYIKSYLYNDYLSPKKYNKILLPSSERFITLALDAGWKNDDIVKVGYPKWDNYEIHKGKILSSEEAKIKERDIFIMFTWRKIKKGKYVSPLYYNNINNLLNNKDIKKHLYNNNIKLFFCYHHTLRDKRIFNIDDDDIVKFISQNEISILLKNSSLIITDFSSILFDAIVQRKPLILYLPDGLAPNLKEIYTKEYFETINKIKNGIIYLHEIFLDLNEVVNKIIYYIKNGFILEKEKLKFYKKFELHNRDNTKNFINYLTSN